MSFEKKLILGAAYYPEDWDESEQEKDISMMKKAGINTVRIGEFAWSKTEPVEGCFDFEWLHKIIDKLYNSGIAVILGTPTATPPIWLEEKDPDMMVESVTGVKMLHGARRNICSNNPTYLEHCKIIVEKLGEEFGKDKNVIGWQVDNEIIYSSGSCCCGHCRSKFTEYLKTKYKTVENLNKAWNLNLFSQNYNDFSQVQIPLIGWQNPHIQFEWDMFTQKSLITFAHMQADILHRFTSMPIGTDMMPIYSVDHEKMTSEFDVVQYNHYNDETNLKNEIFWFDYMRGLKDRPFWNTETSTCWNGAVSAIGDIRPEGFCRANSWMPIVLGGEANLYWLWRQHSAGHEVMHGAVLYPSGRPMHIFDEVRDVSNGFDKCSEFLLNTRVDTDVAFMVSAVNAALMKFQPIFTSATLSDYNKRVLDFYKKITDGGVRADVIGAGKKLDNYRVLFTPYMLTLEEQNVGERIRDWVANGGTWVCGPLCDLRNEIGAHYTETETGFHEKITESFLAYQVPDSSHKTTLEYDNGDGEFSALEWLQLYDISDDSESLVSVKAGYSALIGKSAVFEKKYGKGRIIVLGTIPSKTDFEKLSLRIFEKSKTKPVRVEGEIVVSRRSGNGLNGIALLEYGGKEAVAYLEKPMKDIITGNVFFGKISVEPYGVMVLEEI